MLEASNWKITQGYGFTDFAKAHPSYYKSFGGIHPGIDFIGDKEIMTFTNGVVTQAGWQDGWGFSVTVFDGKYYHLYAHLEKFWVMRGERVTAWETKIGYMGTTGNSTGIHLHYSKYVKTFWHKTYVDPTNDLLFNETDMLIKRIVDQNKLKLNAWFKGDVAIAFDKGREKPFIIKESKKIYYRDFNELFLNNFAVWVSSEDSDKIPTK